MPTIVLRVQQDGYWHGWSALTGATFGYDTVDDSDGTTHDSAATYLTLPRLILSQRQGIVSFPLFLMADGLIPSSITINVVARSAGGGGGAHPRLQIGLSRSGLTGFAASLFTTTSGWTLAQRTFSQNPITATAWSSASELVGLEACVQSEDLATGSNDVTLISGSMDYAVRHNFLTTPEPQGRSVK